MSKAAFSPHPRAGCNCLSTSLKVREAPSLRTLVRVATANMHKMFGVRTDYYVRLNLIECEGRPGGPWSYSHYLDFGTGSRPSYWCEAAIRNMFAPASHSLAVVWWRAGDSNPGPCGYEPLALTY